MTGPKPLPKSFLLQMKVSSSVPKENAINSYQYASNPFYLSI
jgi:hypothetical protein